MRRAFLWVAALSCTLQLSGDSLLAQERVRAPAPELITDRPDRTESTALIPPSLVQIEAGASWAQDDDAGTLVRALAVSEVLLRIGVLPALEARLGFSGWRRRSVAGDGASGPTESGIGDISVGFKTRVLAARAGLPEIAFIGTLLLPTGREGLGAERVEPEARLALAHDLSQRVSLGYNVAATWTSAANGAGGLETNTDLLYTAVLGVALTDRVGAFVEAFGAIALGDNRPSASALDGGLTFLVHERLQLDVTGGVGLNAAAEDWLLGLGFSVRMPR